MKKTIKRAILIVIILMLIPFLYKLGLLYYMFYQEHKTAEVGRNNIEGAMIIAERDAKISAIVMIEEKGTEYEKEGKYDLAIEQYKKALEMGGPEWVERALLAGAYEKSGQYELAVQEINWLIPRIARQEVKDEYIARKQKLEELLKEKMH